jgi:large subunit ribosomal protein L17
MIRNQVTNLLWYVALKRRKPRAKEVRRAAERLITLAIKRV